jgi:hypothetical protein
MGDRPREPRRTLRCPSSPTEEIREGERVVLVNTESTEKYLPTIRGLLGGGL